MFGRVVKICDSRVFLRNGFWSQKISKRLIVTSQSFSSTQQLRESEEDLIVTSPFPSIKYPDWTIDQYVWNDISHWINKIALVDGITDRSLTYGELRDRCRALAIRLQTVLNLKPGDVLAVCLPNSIEYPIICLAAFEAGIVVTTVNPIYTADEISKQLSDSGATVVFGLASMSDILKKAVDVIQRPIKIVYVKEVENESLPSNGIDINELMNPKTIDLSSLKIQDRNADEIAVMPYSSGTTGLPKGVELTHKNIVSNGLGMNSKMSDIILTKPAFGDYQNVMPCVLPWFHIYGLTCTLLSKLSHGSKLISLPRFKPDTYLHVLEKHQSTLLHLVPPIIIFMGNFDKLEEKHTKSIKFIMSGAAPIGAGDVDRFKAKAPHVGFCNGYGLTEASPVTFMSPAGSTNYVSVGKLIADTEAKIVRVDDPKGLGVGPNVSGELWVRGPQIMKGYHNNEKATKETLTSDGWLKTGDIGHYDHNQDFYITDRLKELIKVKGFQVAPAELESLIRDHPDVLDAAVIGIPCPTGELPRAYVVRKSQNLTEQNVKDFVAEKVASYKRLEGGVEFVESIPKNATGKIMRRELKKLFESK